MSAIRVAVLLNTRRDAASAHGGFAAIGRLPALLEGADVVTVHVDDDPATAAGVEVAFGGPNAERVRRLLAAAPDLRWYHTFSAGVEGLLPLLAEHPRLTLTNNSGAYDAPIAEHVISSIFAIAKRGPKMFAAQRKHEWKDGDPRLGDVRGATLVVLGMGSIGGEVARLGAALGMRVVGVRRRAADGALGPDRLAEAAAEADYLAICAPLTASTRGLVDAKVIAAMKPTAWVVNISRGAVVDEQALLEAVREKRIGGAAIDAWWTEPLPADSPWWDLENVIVTPHISYSSPTLGDRSVAFALENFRRYRAGEPLRNAVSRDDGY